MAYALFPAGTLALQREINEGNLPEIATVMRPGPPVDDGEGGSTPGEPTMVTLACRRSRVPASGPERIVADQLQEEGLELLLFAVGGDVRSSDTVTVSGVLYDVRARIPDSTYATRSTALIRPLSPPVAVAA